MVASCNFKEGAATQSLNARYDWHELVCLEYARMHAKYVLETEGLMVLSSRLLRRLVREDQLCASEDDVFRAVLRWASYRVDRQGELATLWGDASVVKHANMSSVCNNVSVDESVNVSLVSAASGDDAAGGGEEGEGDADGRETVEDRKVAAERMKEARVRERRRAAKIKRELKQAEILELLRFPIMSPYFFHHIVEPSQVGAPRLLCWSVWGVGCVCTRARVRWSACLHARLFASVYAPRKSRCVLRVQLKLLGHLSGGAITAAPRALSVPPCLAELLASQRPPPSPAPALGWQGLLRLL